MKTYSVTDTGILREMNQDYYFASETKVGSLPNLFLVADGMGGHQAGDYASRYTIERIVASSARSSGQDTVWVLSEAIRRANGLLLADAQEDLSKYGMGTTIVGAVIEGSRLIAVNVGDSRLYVAGSSLRQITRDHSLVNEMVRMGEIRPEEARNHPKKNIITRAIGAVEEVEPDFFEVELQPQDYILLCTDGLTNMVTDADILDVLHEDRSLEDKCRTLVGLANANGGRDNITVMLIQPFTVG